MITGLKTELMKFSIDIMPLEATPNSCFSFPKIDHDGLTDFLAGSDVKSVT
jgi:hypothetical protein